MNDRWKMGTVYLRHKTKDGKSHFSEMPCWNTDRYIAAQQRAALNENGSIEVITEAAYRRSRK